MPIYFDRDMWLDPSTIAGTEILEPTIDHDLLGFDVRTLPLEERDWTINDDREVPWPMSKPPAQAQDEDLGRLEGLGSNLLNSIPTPADEEDED